MRHHNSLGFSRHERFFQKVEARVEGKRVGVEKDRDGVVLDDGCDGGWKSSGAGDDFVAGTDAAIAELVASERGEGDEIGRGPGVNQDGTLDAEELRQLFFEAFAFFAES